MDNSFGMGGQQSVGHLDRDVEKLVELHRLSALDLLLQALAFELLHHDKGMALIVINIVNDADIGVVQLRGSPRFALETLHRLAVVQKLLRNEFEGNVTAEAGVLGFIDNSHTAAAEFSDDSIVGNSLADHGWVTDAFGANVRPTLRRGQLFESRSPSLPIFREYQTTLLVWSAEGWQVDEVVVRHRFKRFAGFAPGCQAAHDHERFESSFPQQVRHPGARGLA